MAVTEQTGINEALAQYVLQHAPLMESLPYPVLIMDHEMNIITANQSFINYSGTDIVPGGMKCFHLIHESDREPADCPAVKALKSGTKEEFFLSVPSRGMAFIEIASPLIVNGQTVGIMNTFIDISHLKAEIEESSQLVEIYASAVNDMKARELRASRGRDAFLNMLDDVNESFRELDDLFIKLIRLLVSVLDAKSPWTKGHSERVSQYAELISKELDMDEDDVRKIKLAGLLHDVGKIGTYDYLLDKPGKLTSEEFEIVKKHPSQGAAILCEIKQLREIIPLVEYHHEKLDGRGYPAQLQGDQIPIGARILHVADSYDSMTSDRPYRPAPGIEFALSEFQKYKGTQFDQHVVEAFLKVLGKLGKLQSI